MVMIVQWHDRYMERCAYEIIVRTVSLLTISITKHHLNVLTVDWVAPPTVDPPPPQPIARKKASNSSQLRPPSSSPMRERGETMMIVIEMMMIV